MQERYTKQAENVLALAKEAASSCGHSYIGTSKRRWQNER